MLHRLKASSLDSVIRNQFWLEHRHRLKQQAIQMMEGIAELLLGALDHAAQVLVFVVDEVFQSLILQIASSVHPAYHVIPRKTLKKLYDSHAVWESLFK